VQSDRYPQQNDDEALGEYLRHLQAVGVCVCVCVCVAALGSGVV